MSNRLPFLFTIVDRNVCIPCLLTNGTPLTYGTYNHGQEDKRLGTFLHFWGVFQFTQVQQLLSDPTNNVEHMYPEFFRGLNFV